MPSDVFTMRPLLLNGCPSEPSINGVLTNAEARERDVFTDPRIVRVPS